MLEGLKRAFMEDRFDIELETDNEGAFWKWRNAPEMGVIPENRYVVQQLTQKRADINFRMDVRPIDPNANALARYLASYDMEAEVADDVAEVDDKFVLAPEMV
ncbi:hypothetical protein POM88_009376 [Heracleum sosnowskyi]|uniref:Uncharacterized protein n=1 Tax=Heracleum sosnowskyi TaxID=360622 RepID=A0AAD8N9G2_9APIA|nr:hypothetical protein POM88_009376 [Heracleum sosnowskyi]